LINFVFQFLGDREQSEDVVQDTMLKLYVKKHYYREIAKFSTWIYTIARNLANTELRKRKRRKTTLLSQMTRDERDYDLPAIQPEIGQEVQSEFAEKRIQTAIHALPEHFKTVIILRDIQELSYDDISSIVNVPLGTVKSRINRARLQLQVDLKDLR
jgi:RNA polymerase sigma-70 factor (ECF subfamily)